MKNFVLLIKIVKNVDKTILNKVNNIANFKEFIDNNKNKIQTKVLFKKIKLIKDSKIFPELNFNIFDDLLKK